jgi:hypothetical protein
MAEEASQKEQRDKNKFLYVTIGINKNETTIIK